MLVIMLGVSDHVSDHASILCDLKIKNDLQFISSKKANWGKFTAENIVTLSEDIEWGFSNDNLSVEDMWDELHTKLLSIADHVPMTDVKCSKNGNVITRVPWDCSSLKRRRKAKDAAWAEFDHNPSPQNLNIALYKQKIFDTEQSRCMINYENKITSNMKGNPKRFFAYLNSKRKIKQNVT